MKSVGLGKARKGLVATFGIVQQRAESETGGNPIRNRALAVFEHRCEAPQLRFVRLLPGDGETAVGLRPIRIEIDGAAEAHQCLVEPAEAAQQGAELVPCRRVIRGERHRPAEPSFTSRQVLS